jgi:hypothetical protein
VTSSCGGTENRSQESKYRQLLAAAENSLWTSFEASGALKHSLSQGESREAAIASFLRAQLSTRFGVTSGEAVDAEGRSSTQLDVMIFDAHGVPKLYSGAAASILPVEGLLSVIEVKTELRSKDVAAVCHAVNKLAELRPYGEQFVTPRTGGKPRAAGSLRCMYTLFAFSSDLSPENWPQNEWDRLIRTAAAKGTDLRRLDRVVVLDRGLIMPGSSRARTTRDEDKTLLGEWFVHLTQFLTREISKRRPFEWHPYEEVSGRPWMSLKPRAAGSGTRQHTKKTRKPPGRTGRGQQRGRPDRHA